MKKINKKGFTLIELLAVIVLLAIVGVVGANAIISRMNKGKADTFVNNYNDIMKEVSQSNVLGEFTGCNDAGTNKCSSLFDYSASDYKVEATATDGVITLTVEGIGTNANINLPKYYCSTKMTTGAGVCKASDESRKKLSSRVTSVDKTTIVGTYGD